MEDSANLFSENLSAILDDGDFIQFLNNEPFNYSPESLAQLDSPELLFDQNISPTVNAPYRSPPPNIGNVFIKPEKSDGSPPLVDVTSQDSKTQFHHRMALVPQSDFDNPNDDIKISKRASQNRVASRNYRKRKKQYVEDLEEQLRQMILENQKLRREQYLSQVQISSLAEESTRLQQVGGVLAQKLSCKKDLVEETAVLKQLETQLATGASNEELFATISHLSSMCSRAIQDAIADLKEFITPTFLIQFCFNTSEEEEEEESLTELTEAFKKEVFPRVGFSPQQIQSIGATYPSYKEQFSQLKATRKRLAEDLRKYLIQRHFLRTKQMEALPTSSVNILSAVDAVISGQPQLYSYDSNASTYDSNASNPREAKRPFMGAADKTLFLEDQSTTDALTLPSVETSINQTMDHLRQNLLDEQGLYIYYFRQVSSVLSVTQQAIFVLFMRKRSISCSQTIKLLWILFAPESTQITFPRNSPLILK